MANTDILKRALSTKVYFQRVTALFDPQMAFSKCELHLTSKFSGFKRFLRLSTIFDAKKSMTLYARDGENIKKALSTVLKIEPNETEARCVVAITELLAPLCREVLLGNYYGEESFTPPISASAIGLGSLTTWHGCPDLRLRAGSPGPELNIILPNNSPEDEESEEESDGDGVNVEIKKKVHRLFRSVMSQAVATAVVASFINNNKHETSITPLIVMCKKFMHLCLYDCISDVLLVCEEVALSVDGVVSESGLALIWLMLHCRYVLRKNHYPRHACAARWVCVCVSLCYLTSHFSNVRLSHKRYDLPNRQ